MPRSAIYRSSIPNGHRTVEKAVGIGGAVPLDTAIPLDDTKPPRLTKEQPPIKEPSQTSKSLQKAPEPTQIALTCMIVLDVVRLLDNGREQD